ncbi:AarF/UbiB family protein [Ligilactobacillus sp. Marseille-Q7487]|uniref:ABC1 kinase family protein n=1 Tax=Ligilactobacillus sp. Marseille-Q7487 TaxID=3022128 RepID=UPI0024A89923|nr:AarF/UbiB family protein [Ligilactobacillus sp. Marseille-Q7487]
MTVAPTIEITRKDKRSRLLEIVHVIREHDMIKNFLKQKNPKEIRLGLQELGPTFIKAGQLLSTRPDLVSPEYIKELRKLQDNVQIDSFETIAQIFLEQTGKSIAETFASFEKQPFASGSIGQTHKATLKDNTPVVVKIQHPKVEELVNTDLSLFRQAIHILKFAPDISVINPKEILNEIQTALLNEIDTQVEMQNGEEFYQLNNATSIIEVPKVYREYSAPKVLVNSLMPGKSIQVLVNQKLSDDPKKAAQQKKLRRFIGEVLVQNFIKQVFTDNFFHADPHPGNILFYELPQNSTKLPRYQTTHQFQKTLGSTDIDIATQKKLPACRLVYLDFGMMGHLTPNLVDGITNIILALNTKDTRLIGQAILAVCNRTGKVDEEDFYEELGVFLQPYMQMGLGQIDLADMLFSILSLCRNNNLQAKSEVTLLVKAFASLEGLVAQLDPDLAMMDVVRPFARDYLKKKLNLRNELEDHALLMAQAIKATPQIPIKVERLLDIFMQGQGRINFKFKEQDRFFDRVDQLVNRIVISIILAALILGSSMLVMGGQQHPAIYNLGVCGYIISFVLILFLVITTLHNHYKNKQ